MAKKKVKKVDMGKIYENKLRKIKDKLYDEFEKKEMETREYYKTVYKLLLEEGVVYGRYTEDDTRDLTIHIAVNLERKINLRKYRGLEKEYITREDVKLSLKAKEDVRKINELENKTRDFLKKKIGNKLIFGSEYNKIVEEYLKKQTNLSKIATREAQRDALIRIRINLEREFNLRKDSEKIGRYDLQTMKEALEKI